MLKSQTLCKCNIWGTVVFSEAFLSGENTHRCWHCWVLLIDNDYGIVAVHIHPSIHRLLYNVKKILHFSVEPGAPTQTRIAQTFILLCVLFHCPYFPTAGFIYLFFLPWLKLQVFVCRISCGFLGAFFVYLNRQVVLFMRRPNAMTRFLTK